MKQIDQAIKDRNAALLASATTRRAAETTELEAQTQQKSMLESAMNKNVADRTAQERALVNQDVVARLSAIVETLPDDFSSAPLEAVITQLLAEGEALAAIPN